MRLPRILPSAILLAAPAAAQPTAPRPPVIDMHVHSTTTAPAAVPRLEQWNVRYLFLAALSADLPEWAAKVDPGRYLPALVFPCPGGRAYFRDKPCYDGSADLPDPAWLRKELQAGRIRGFGEMAPQLMGIAPNDPRLDPYWRLAEEFDIPVGIHVGPGPPAAAYESTPAPFRLPAFRMALGDPLLLEDVLLRHRRLRLFVMHAGWPRLDSMIALLYAHPNIYVDTAALSAEFMVPRASYYRHLRGLVEAGFSHRILFGSDFPNQVGPGIDAILAADFLTPDQRAAILCGNAARFLRLPASMCRSEPP